MTITLRARHKREDTPWQGTTEPFKINNIRTTALELSVKRTTSDLGSTSGLGFKCSLLTQSLNCLFIST